MKLTVLPKPRDSPQRWCFQTVDGRSTITRISKIRVFFFGGLPKEGLVKSCEGILEGAGSLASEKRGVRFKARQVSVKLPAGAKGREEVVLISVGVSHAAILQYRKESESGEFTSLKRAKQSTRVGGGKDGKKGQLPLLPSQDGRKADVDAKAAGTLQMRLAQSTWGVQGLREGVRGLPGAGERTPHSVTLTCWTETPVSLGEYNLWSSFLTSEPWGHPLAELPAS